MKQKTKKLITIYYSVLLMIVLVQVISTCVKLGQTLSYQHRLHALQQRQQQLEQTQEKLARAYNLNTSLLASQLELNTHYQPINSPIVISSQQTIALK